jgi:hypothetical protein
MVGRRLFGDDAVRPYQRLSTLTVRPEGSPDGEPVSWAFSDDQEVIEEITTPRSEEEVEPWPLALSAVSELPDR